MRSESMRTSEPYWDARERIIKLGLFLVLVGVLSAIAFKPADPAAYTEEPWSFTHNLFICTFDTVDDPAGRQSLTDTSNS